MKIDNRTWACGRRVFMASLVTLAAAGVLAADQAAAQNVKRGGTLVIARPEEPLSWNPYTQGDNGSIYAIEQVCDSLVEADATGRGLRPGLAESWEMSADGLSYTFTLRDAKFSDGSPVTVDDVVFSWGKLNDPSAAYQFLLKPVKSIEKVDDKHMKVSLNELYSPFPSVASIFAAAIVKKAAFEANPDEFANKPVCSGPFMVESYERGTKVVLAKNPHYWELGADGQPLPYLDKVELLYVPDTNARVLGLQNGDYDVSLIIPYNQAKAVSETPDMTLEVAEIFRLDYVYLNHKQKPLDDERIRLAMNHAANLPAINKAVSLRLRPDPELDQSEDELLVPGRRADCFRRREGQGTGQPRPAMTARRSSCASTPATRRQSRSPPSCSRVGRRPASRWRSRSWMSARPGIPSSTAATWPMSATSPATSMTMTSCWRCRPIRRRPAPRASSRATRTRR